MKTSGHSLGQAGEAVAAAWLEARGWQVRARRWRAARREVDIVAEKGGVLAFVEVKTRSARALAPPTAAVDARKRARIAAAARVAAARWRGVESFRFDVIAVTWERDGPRVEHYEDAFRLRG